MLPANDLKRGIRKLLRKFSWDVVRYNAQSSEWVSLVRMFLQHEISVVLDVGANEGQYAQRLRENGFNGRIVSFEPLIGPHQKLCSLAAPDPLWIVPRAAAIGKEEGYINIHVSRNTACSSVLPILDRCIDVAPDAAYVSTETVAMTTLDKINSHFIDPNDRVFLKIDVQGFERQVLEGARQLLPSIIGIQIEASLVPLYGGETCFSEHLEYLTHAGFDFWSVIPGLVDKSSGRMLQVDGIFFRPEITDAQPRPASSVAASSASVNEGLVPL